MNKLGFSEKEVEHMTYLKWKKLYSAYKLNFDLELSLNVTKQRYSDIEKEPSIDEIIPV